MPKKNAFFYFMLEYKRREEAKGRKFQNLGQVTPLAGEIWEKMNVDERKPFVEQANKGSEGSKEKLTTLGLSISSVESKIRQQKLKQQETEDLTDLRVMLTSSKTELAKEVFYFISMEYFCRTRNGVYIPAELGVVKYSLASGVMDKLHLHVNAREIPLGYAGPTLEHVKKTHQLPVPPNALGISDFDEIANTLLTFLGTDAKLPLLFTDAAAVPAVENMLSCIMGTREYTVNSMYICPLAPLLFKLIQGTARYNETNAYNIPSALMAQEILSVDQYGHTQGISCDYHENQANGYHCALSRSIRWTYIISTCCCKNLGIELIPGRHIPESCKALPIGENLDGTDDDSVDCGAVSGNNPPLSNHEQNSPTDSVSASQNMSRHTPAKSVASEVEPRLEHFRNLSITDRPKSLSPPGASPSDRTDTTISGAVQKKGNPFSENTSIDETSTDGNSTLDRISRRVAKIMEIKYSNNYTADKPMNIYEDGDSTLDMFDQEEESSMEMQRGYRSTAGNTTLDRICREWKKKVEQLQDRAGTSIASTKPKMREQVDSVGNNTLDRIIASEVEKRLYDAMAFSKHHTDEISSRSLRDSTLDITGTSIASSTHSSTHKVLQALELSDIRAAEESRSMQRKVTQSFISSEVEKRLKLALNASKTERERSKNLRSEYTLNSTNTSISSSGHSKMLLAMQLSESRAAERAASIRSGSNNTFATKSPVEQTPKLSEGRTAESVASHCRVKYPSNRTVTSVSSLERKKVEQQPDTSTAGGFVTPLENPRRMDSIASDNFDYEPPVSVSYQPRMYNRSCKKVFPSLQEAAAVGSESDRSRGRGRGRFRGRGRGRGRGHPHTAI